MSQKFSTTDLGRRLAQLRKEQNWTQGEVAEKLYVSHQAVSSWEKGLTSPDISKLADLSQLYKVSIDQLLDHSISARAVKKIQDQQPLQVEELMEISAITKPKELSEFIDKSEPFDEEALICLAPYLSSEQLVYLIERRFQAEPTTTLLVSLAPFLNTKDLEAFLSSVSQRIDSDLLPGLAPFLSSDYLSQIIRKSIADSAEISDQTALALAPFIDTEYLEACLSSAPEKIDSDLLLGLAPFLSSDYLSQTIRESLADCVEIPDQTIVALAPFLKTEDLEACLLHCANKLSSRLLSNLAPFVSSDFLVDLIETLARKPSSLDQPSLEELLDE